MKLTNNIVTISLLLIALIASNYIWYRHADPVYKMNREGADMRVTCLNGGDATVRTADGPFEGELGYIVVSCGE